MTLYQQNHNKSPSYSFIFEIQVFPSLTRLDRGERNSQHQPTVSCLGLCWNSDSGRRGTKTLT